jgi:hypothetical protein
MVAEMRKMTFVEVLAWMFVVGAVAVIVAFMVAVLPIAIPVFIVAGIIWLITNPHVLGVVLLVVGLAFAAFLVLGAIASAFPGNRKASSTQGGMTSPQKVARDPGDRTPRTAVTKGECPVCARQVRLTAARGLVATHITNGARCGGMGAQPTRPSPALAESE